MFCQRMFTKRCVGVVVGILTVFGMIYQIPENPHKILPQEIRKFAFAKNHKCGSSIVENIIFRFAIKKQLNLVIPLEGSYLSKITLFNHSHLQEIKWKNVPYDIFSLHSRWNRKEVMAVLKQEVPAFTIIRNPVDVFVSFFHYRDKIKEFYEVKNIHELVRKIHSQPSVMSKRWWGTFGRNQMAWDLGLSPFNYENQTAMEIEIQRLDTEFDLVMISDRMDESLILLKELLHWPMENVVHLDLNRRKLEKSNTLSSEERKILSKWLSADVQIFKYFSRRFDERVAELNKKQSWGLFGHNFVEKETRLLKKANKELYDRCILDEVDNEKLKEEFQWYGDSIIGYVINDKRDDCVLYARNQAAYLKLFRNSLTELQNKIENKM